MNKSERVMLIPVIFIWIWFIVLMIFHAIGWI